MTEIPITPYDHPDGWRVGDPAFLEGQPCSCGLCDRNTHYRPEAQLAEGFIIWDDGFASRGGISEKCANRLITYYASAGETCTYETPLRHDGGSSNVLRYRKDPIIQVRLVGDTDIWLWQRRYRPHNEDWCDWTPLSGKGYRSVRDMGFRAALDALHAAAYLSHIPVGNSAFHRIRDTIWTPDQVFEWPPKDSLRRQR